MRESQDVFHVAIPAANLDDAQEFYVTGLGCHLARRYADRITLDFFGDQVVCHLCEDMEVEAEPELYPRHFGVSFRRRDDFDALVACATTRKLTVFRDPEVRFAGRVEEHLTFVLRDPSSNLLEFKHYRDPRMMY
jgi:extradiol dioxygenase family protein